MATAKDDGASIDVSKPKLEKFRSNDRDTLDIKTWCQQVSRLDTVQKLGDKVVNEMQKFKLIPAFQQRQNENS
jgi:hypothetical protein